MYDEKLREHVNILQITYNNLLNRLKELTDWIRNIEDNFYEKIKNLDSKIAEFEKHIYCLPSASNDVLGRLTKLEGLTETISENLSMASNSSRVHLEVNVNNLHSRVDGLEKIIEKNLQARKYPHKCPACNGIGADINSMDAHRIREWGLNCPLSCHSCQGKGIVWG